MNKRQHVLSCCGENLRGEFLEAVLEPAGGATAEMGELRATHLLKGERFLHLPEAKLSVRRTGKKIEVSASVFARQVMLEIPGTTGAVFEDNFFDLVPGQKRTVEIVDSAGGKDLLVRAVRADTVRTALGAS